MYAIIIENGLYMLIGTFNVTAKEHLCKYDVMKLVTFNTETLYLHNCDPHLKEIEIFHIKQLS